MHKIRVRSTEIYSESLSNVTERHYFQTFQKESVTFTHDPSNLTDMYFFFRLYVVLTNSTQNIFPKH
jgi:hypothetical protein